MSTGIIFDVKKYAIHDGPGIRTTVFFKGCPLNCQWCHNPESIDPHPEPSLDYRDPFRLDPYGEEESDTIGEKVSADAVMDEILKDRIFYDESGGGVTFSGGEPLAQPDFLAYLLRRCKQEEIHTAVDTSGYAPKEALEKIAGHVDLFLFDLKLVDTKLHEEYTGVGNELILDNLTFLVEDGRKIELRFPLIPGITDSEENVAGIKEIIEGGSGFRKLSILPFHDVTKKYSRLGRDFPLAGLEPPAEDVVKKVREEIEQTGIMVKVGG